MILKAKCSSAVSTFSFTIVHMKRAMWKCIPSSDCAEQSGNLQNLLFPNLPIYLQSHLGIMAIVPPEQSGDWKWTICGLLRLQSADHSEQCANYMCNCSWVNYRLIWRLFKKNRFSHYLYFLIRLLPAWGCPVCSALLLLAVTDIGFAQVSIKHKWKKFKSEQACW